MTSNSAAAAVENGFCERLANWLFLDKMMTHFSIFLKSVLRFLEHVINGNIFLKKCKKSEKI